jgi:hypothetical protein
MESMPVLQMWESGATGRCEAEIAQTYSRSKPSNAGTKRLVQKIKAGIGTTQRKVLASQLALRRAQDYSGF